MTEVDQKDIWIKPNDWCYHCGRRFDKVVEMYSNYKNIAGGEPNGAHFTRLCKECLNESLSILNSES